MTTAMTTAATPNGATAPARVSWSAGVVRVVDEGVLGAGAGQDALCERFVRRAFGAGGVRSLSVDRSRGAATIRHDTDPAGEPARFLRRLAAAVRDGGARPGLRYQFPARVPGPCYTLHRHGAVVSLCEVVGDRPGRLTVRYDGLRGAPAPARRVGRLLETVPGVLRVSTGVRTGTVRVGYDPALLTAPRLLRLTEKALLGPDAWAGAVPEPAPVSFGLANTTLGIAAAGELALSALLPVSAVLLVGTNLGTFRTAWGQVRRRELGLPVLYTAIIAAALASGQFLSSALMSWLFRFWLERHRRDLAVERHRLLDACLPRPALVRLAPGGDGNGGAGEVLVEAGTLRAGDRVVVGAGEAVPADGRVVAGAAVVDERSLRGREGAARRGAGDAVLAGSVVLEGEVTVAVERTGERTRAAAIGRALLAATNPDPGRSAPTRDAERQAERAVGPTLATAGLGLLVGDLTAVSAILRPDYATGPGLAVPLETLRDVAACAADALVVRDAGVFDRLGETGLVALDDHPALARTGLEVAEARSDRLPEAELLRYAASALRHLDDPRAAALADACRARGLHRLDLEVVDFKDGVAVRHGRHVVRVREAGRGSAGPGGPLAVAVNGVEVGRVAFRPSPRPEAAAAVKRLREATGAHVALLSHRPRAEVAPLAAALGVNQVVDGLTPDARAGFLRGCRARGVKAVFVGDCRANAAAAAAAHVAVDLAGDDRLGDAPVALLGGRLDRLDALWGVARGHARRVRSGRAFVVVPNLACVAGAFLFGFNGLAAVAVSNLGTLGIYNRAAVSLRALDRVGRRRPGRWHQGNY